MSKYLILLCLLWLSCSSPGLYDDVMVSPGYLLSNSRVYWAYHLKYVKLWEDFSAQDSVGDPIDKRHFLKLLTTGSYMPLALTPVKDRPRYLLYPLHSDSTTHADTIKDISYIVQVEAKAEYDRYETEGTGFPDFSFSDVTGQSYSTKTCRGKVLIFKLWYVHCSRCIDEMPSWNTLVKDHEGQADVQFMSLVRDDKAAAAAYLGLHPVAGPVIPGQSAFIGHALNIEIFPSYIVVNKKMTILKTFQDIDDLKDWLGEEKIIPLSSSSPD